MEQNSIWKNLPVDVLEEIMKRLPLREYLELRSICFPWWISVCNVIAKEHCPPLPELPLVLLRNEDLMLFSLSTESVHRLKTTLLKRAHICHGSVEGWLIVSDNTVKGSATFFFLNAVTKDRIMIPSKLYFPSKSLVQGHRYMAKMVASSKPVRDCYLAGILNDFCQIAIYKLFEKSWTIIEPDKDSRIYFKDLEIIGTKLYVRTDTISHSILVYDLKDSTNGPPKAEMLTKLPKLRQLVSSSIGNHCIDVDHTLCFLAKDEASRELYLIYMMCNMEYTVEYNTVSAFVKPPEYTTIKVFKLEMNKEPIGWQNVRMDDRVAFVSSYKCMVMSRDKLNYNKELIRGNSIYIALNFPCPKSPWSGFQLGVFCLTNRSMKYFPFDTSNHCRVPRSLWFVPSL
ncbi:uncharacterized protein [Cicer arietinum]|uniref:Uncharacterized protein LOC101489378 n=1 Tax=Cicer arietinum TaxID=3827 RepID=A0A1S3E101_CICAR|nr:uncharacterized protein LOC101489378 [Cicer arietinum]